MNLQENKPQVCDIRIDKEGVWFFRGAEMFRREIVNFFYQNLRQDDNGRYIIELENDSCYIDVDDTAYIVKSVFREARNDNGREEIILLLSDGTTESLDPATLWIGEDNVLYCRVRNLTFDARFSRAGYYQLAESISYNEEKDLFYILLNGNEYNLVKRERKG